MKESIYPFQFTRLAVSFTKFDQTKSSNRFGHGFNKILWLLFRRYWNYTFLSIQGDKGDFIQSISDDNNIYRNWIFFQFFIFYKLNLPVHRTFYRIVWRLTSLGDSKKKSVHSSFYVETKKKFDLFRNELPISAYKNIWNVYEKNRSPPIEKKITEKKSLYSITSWKHFYRIIKSVLVSIGLSILYGNKIISNYSELLSQIFSFFQTPEKKHARRAPFHFISQPSDTMKCN